MRLSGGAIQVSLRGGAIQVSLWGGAIKVSLGLRQTQARGRLWPRAGDRAPDSCWTEAAQPEMPGQQRCGRMQRVPQAAAGCLVTHTK